MRGIDGVKVTPMVPCPICGGEAVHAQDVLARTIIAPAPGVGIPDDSRTVQQIDAPDAGPMPSICEGMEKPDLWAYAHLCGYRAALGVEGRS